MLIQLWDTVSSIQDIKIFNKLNSFAGVNVKVRSISNMTEFARRFEVSRKNT